jgi:pimeloyl-ACP methyl ester carboxylesterase
MATTLSQSIRPQFRTIEGLAIRFAESEPRPDDALLLNPWPESLYAYEPTWSRLAEHARLVAIDLPGFGHSERRDIDVAAGDERVRRPRCRCIRPGTTAPRRHGRRL